MPFDQYRTVVAAIDRLTTQVGRVADAMATPVVEEDDAPQTTGDDAAMNLKRGPWVPACESGRHVVHGGMDCDEVDQFQARFGQWASSVSAQFDSFMTASDAPQTTDDDARQRAYDAVFAVIRSQPLDFLPTTVVERNALLWRAVHAALDAAPRTAPAGKAAGGN
ncbi:hypothetical protein AB0I93_14375 [Streptomyces sp. NPDC049967]|uniref:hypothetical protein n=1 Tax=Streptomyces sp. NPDC049967 TaxID=3155658 RepID=UPI0034289FA3